MILAQLPDLLAADRGEKQYEYQHSNFFAEQLTAFEVYLEQDALEQKIPEQLPIVLQVLLSQVHRLRALILLSKFLDLGPWAVNLALSIGIFPYVLKLLQSQAAELKPVMIFIWARILAVDQSCQTDLLKDNGYQYFVSIINPVVGALFEEQFRQLINANNGKNEYVTLLTRYGVAIPIGNVSEHRAMCAFIVAVFCKDFHQGQVVSLSNELFEGCLLHLGDLDNPLLRQWSCLCISMLWVDFPDAKWTGVRCSAHQRLCNLVVDPVADVRAAMLHALTSFLGIPDLTPQVVQIEESIASMVLIMASDGNVLVRKELLVFFSTFIARYQNRFIVTAYEQLVEEKAMLSKFPADRQRETTADNAHVRSRSIAQGDHEFPPSISSNTVFAAMWKQVLIMSVDPYPEVAQNASIIVDYMFGVLLESPLQEAAQSLLDDITQLLRQTGPSNTHQMDDGLSQPQASQPSTPPTPSKQDGYFSLGIRRTASVAASLMNMAIGGTTSQDTSPPSTTKSPSKTIQNTRSNAARSRIPAEWQNPSDEKGKQQVPTSRQIGEAPQPKYFRRRDLKEEPRIPLRSSFFEWSVEYFREPQMKPNEADEPGSTDYNERLWRRNRNDKIMQKTQPQKEMAGSAPWNKHKGFFNNGTQPLKMCFHQFEDHLVVTDDNDLVT